MVMNSQGYADNQLDSNQRLTPWIWQCNGNQWSGHLGVQHSVYAYGDDIRLIRKCVNVCG